VLLLPGCFPQPGNFDGKSTAFAKSIEINPLEKKQFLILGTTSTTWAKNKFYHVECKIPQKPK